MATKAQAFGLWTLTTLAFLLFLPTTYIGLGGLAGGGAAGGLSPIAAAYLATMLAVPILCIAGPVLGWRSVRRDRIARAFWWMTSPFLALALAVLGFFAYHLVALFG